jgi:hypothetical protein
MVEDGYHDATDRRLLRLGIDPELPELIIYLFLKYNVRTLQDLEAKLLEKSGPPIETGE